MKEEAGAVIQAHKILERGTSKPNERVSRGSQHRVSIHKYSPSEGFLSLISKGLCEPVEKPNRGKPSLPQAWD